MRCHYIHLNTARNSQTKKATVPPRIALTIRIYTASFCSSSANMERSWSAVKVMAAGADAVLFM